MFEYFRVENAPEMAADQLPGLELDEAASEELATETIF
jgi:hypothetical protein